MSTKKKECGFAIPSGVTVRKGLIHWYTVYKGEKESLFIQGPAKLCAAWMGLSVGDFRKYCSESKGLPYHGWVIFTDLIDPAEVYERI